MRWAQVTINAEAVAVDAVGNCLNAVGCTGFVVNDEAIPPSVSGYLPVDDRLELRLNDLATSLDSLTSFGVEGAGTEITLTYVEEDDWANAWKAFYKPMRIGRRIIVTPPWEAPELSVDDLVIVIDPGMAFGTGSHPTTQLCLAALEDFVARGCHVADIGTGSGILAIASAKLGATAVCGCDIDPLAVDIAKNNANVNVVSADFAETIPDGKFDIIVANILADVIIDLAADLRARLVPRGLLIVSGIIDSRESDVVAALQALGLTMIEIRRQGEWVAIITKA